MRAHESVVWVPEVAELKGVWDGGVKVIGGKGREDGVMGGGDGVEDVRRVEFDVG